jgi:hypothetical protein
MEGSLLEGVLLEGETQVRQFSVIEFECMITSKRVIVADGSYKMSKSLTQKTLSMLSMLQHNKVYKSILYIRIYLKTKL